MDPRATCPRIAAVLLGWLLPAALCAQSEPVRITFLDVGQGDAVVIQAPEGQTALVDAGPGADILPALEALAVEQLDLVVATHPHADHIGGMLRVIESMPVRFYMDNGRPHTTATYLSLMRELQRRDRITYLEAVPRTLQLGSVSIEILPLPTRATSNLNNQSVGLVLRYGEFGVFLSGDSELPEIRHFYRSARVPDVTVLKAPHHGSEDAVSDTLLWITQPEVVVISVGRDNTYGHPSASALYAYGRFVSEVYRTDLHGDVTVLGYEDGRYEVTFEETRTSGVGVGDGPADVVARHAR